MSQQLRNALRHQQSLTFIISLHSGITLNKHRTQDLYFHFNASTSADKPSEITIE